MHVVPVVYQHIFPFSRTQTSLFNVGGQDCDSLFSCPFHSLGSRECAGRDRLNIYDGVDEYSPLVGTFCGLGEFPSAVVGTGRELFLEFITTEEGPFLNDGFDLRVGHLPGGGIQGGDEGGGQGCHRTFNSAGLDNGEGIFLSPRHWYPPGTNCTYLIKVSLEKDFLSNSIF